MTYFTKVGSKYKVINDIGAWLNYTPANQNDPHSRGESTGESEFSLKDKIVTITAHIHRVEEGYPVNTGEPYKPFEVVKVTVPENTTEYWAWVVYDGTLNVEEYIEQERQEQTDESIQPVIDPKPNGKEVVVHAGQTTVLDVKTDKAEEKKEEKKNPTETGSIEVELVDEAGQPYQGAEVVHLISESHIYALPIDKNTGKGSKDGIVPGKYDVALQLGVVLFEFDKDVPTSAGRDAFQKIDDKITTAKNIGFKKLSCIGYTDKDGSVEYNKTLCLKRAIFTKNTLADLQDRFSREYITTRIGGELPGDGEEEKSVNRKVEIIAVL